MFAKPEIRSPAGIPMTPTEQLSPVAASSQDAQNPWPTRSLFQSPTPPPTPPPGQATPATAPSPSPRATASKSISPPAPPPTQLAAAGKAQPPAKAPTLAKAPAPTSGAITKRIMRCLEPNSKGVFKVAKEIRDQFSAGGKSKERVIKLFASCENNPDRTICCMSCACIG